ncbi:MAG TPA: hypothetical protein VFJ82_13735, partial [Longimicrobium sp.]|nr:hypothetical protein [Longimicrobium sp.]
LFAYGPLRLYGLPPGDGAGAGVAGFPWLRPAAGHHLLGPVERLMAPVPPGARVLMETRSAHRDAGGYRTVFQAAEASLSVRGAELVPDEYARAFNPGFVRVLLAGFAALAEGGAGEREVREMARSAGAGWILAFDPATVRALAAMGWREEGRLVPSSLPAATARLLAMPGAELVLLRAPFAAGTLDPPVADAAIERNTLRWTARAGVEYRVAYAWDPRFRARQGGGEVAVRADEAAGGDFRAIRLRATSDGPLALTFHGGWL